jgi:hypothetical protein
MSARDKAGQTVRVRSVDAIAAFRSAYITHGTKARPLVEDAWDEVARTREWLRSDRRTHWENEVRRRRRRLDDAQQALFSARFSTLKPVTAAEQAAVQRARRALADAEAKLENVRGWLRQFDDRAAPLLKQLEELRTILTVDFTKGSAYLGHVIQALDRYTEAPQAVRSESPPPAEPAESAADAQSTEQHA